MSRKYIGLTRKDKKHWWPNVELVHWLCWVIPEGARVLDIGPGKIPFPKATHCVDFTDRPQGEDIHEKAVKQEFATIKADVNTDRLPFADKEFDFVYCRHVIEDLWNPFHACAEMMRVGKRGYIETPSPVAEMCRGVDVNNFKWRGYAHHHWMIWENGGKLCFLSKYPLVEKIIDVSEENIAPLKNGSATYWNSYFLWKDGFEIRHYQPTVDFEFMQGYQEMISRATSESMRSTNAFVQRFNQPAAAA